jgi:hypothetical protein
MAPPSSPNTTNTTRDTAHTGAWAFDAQKPSIDSKNSSDIVLEPHSGAGSVSMRDSAEVRYRPSGNDTATDVEKPGVEEREKGV